MHKNVICVSMKILKSLHTKETIYWTKGLSLLTSVDTKTSSSFYSMIARTKCYVFTEIFPAVFLMRPPFWPVRIMFFIIKQKLSSSIRRLLWGILRGIFPVKTARKWRHFFVWILLQCNFFVICYYLLSKDFCEVWNFKYQNLVFSFLTYVIILLFPRISIVIVIEHFLLRKLVLQILHIYAHLTSLCLIRNVNVKYFQNKFGF